MDNLVSTEWLAAELGKPDLIVFDTTKYLPNEPFDGRQKFLEAHIPGARFYDIDEVADPDAALPHMIPSAARFEKLMDRLGVSNNSRIVFYDQKGLQSSARGWWLMRLFGHEKAAVLDGGLPKWVREGRAVQSGAEEPEASAGYVADLVAGRVLGIGDLKRILENGDRLILDARAAGRFKGTAPEPRPGLPSGHMPGAANIPFNELFAADGTMLPEAALRARFALAGADGSRPLATSCGTGVTACILTLGALRAGLPEPAVYDGSWTEWASRPETPKVTA
ncbi:sulfurtransferase [Roseococcus sp. SYP-B2431]|uniref:sulfurtransferase n=1 Tax=Roseococcus sp. SYP-B2431 TaxID=2496640 RepID=UPI00103AD99B|nr:rhodanese-like domain-containing protein [Roseococcus sp. SYP-B2431]TCH97093.1 sulfurtransferase [Roseococcus sp. SYP-B2431]